MAENKGQFQKGKSGNPKGRPKKPEWAKEKFKEITPQAIETLEKVLKSRKASLTNKIKAAEIILNYSVGKPRQEVGIEAEVQNTAAVEVRFEGDIEKWSR